MPKVLNNLVIVEDLIREDLARGISLKISETSYLPVRNFGLEQFLQKKKNSND